jgi:transglutaminase-like putative cysteine protease
VLYAITHRTTYRYRFAVSVSHHLLHLRPRATPRQRPLDFVLAIEPEPAAVKSHTDFHGNTVTFLEVESTHRELTVIARSRVEVAAPSLPAPAATPAWEKVREACGQDVLTPDSEAGEFLFDSSHVLREAALADYATPCFPAGRPLLEGVIELTSRIFRDFKFDPRATNIATPVMEVFRKRRGVCQDFAHLGITCLRSLGLPARYVSGYLETLPPPGRPRLIGADVSHAWISVWCPGFGWIDTDPTNDQLVSDRYVTLAWGRDFGDVTPMRGVVVGGGLHTLDVGIDVVRAEETLARK